MSYCYGIWQEIQGVMGRDGAICLPGNKKTDVLSRKGSSQVQENKNELAGNSILN